MSTFTRYCAKARTSMAADGAPHAASDGAGNERQLSMEAKLEASAAAHQASIERRRLASQLAHDPSEDVDAFLRMFESEINAIKLGAAEGERLVGQVAEATVHFDGMSMRCAELNKRLSSASMFLPSYQLRQRQQSLAALLAELDVSRSRVVPKKKFSFARKKAATTAPTAVPAPEPESEHVAERLSAVGDNEQFDPAYLIKSLNGATCVRLSGDIAAHDFAITDLEDCTVYLLDVIGALYIKRLTRCRIITGPVQGSVHINDARQCTISLAARQIRMHHSTSCKMHVFCASDPIIEHCQDIGVGEYALSYIGSDQHMQDAGLASLEDRRRQVQDFNWLRQTQSPNWSLLGEAELEVELALRKVDAEKLAEQGHMITKEKV